MQKSPEYIQAFGDECAHDTENMVNHILYFDQENKNNNTHSLSHGLQVSLLAQLTFRLLNSFCKKLHWVGICLQLLLGYFHLNLYK